MPRVEVEDAVVGRVERAPRGSRAAAGRRRAPRRTPARGTGRRRRARRPGRRPASASRSASRSSNRNDGWTRTSARRRRRPRAGSRGRGRAVGRRVVGRPIARGAGSPRGSDPRRGRRPPPGRRPAAVPVVIGSRPGPAPRSRATDRRPRWISTRTAPSDLPRTPAISAVRHLVHEPQQHRAAPVVGQAVQRAQGLGRLVAESSPRPRCPPGPRRPARRRARPRARRPGRRRCGSAARSRRRCARSGTATRGTSTRPDPSSGRGELVEPRQGRERAHEHALRRVLRGVVVGELVEGVGIHLGEVLPVQGVERGGIPPRRLDERAIAVERDDASSRRSLPPSKHRPSHRVTPRRR